MLLNLTSCRSNKQVGAKKSLTNHSWRHNVAGQSEHRRAGTLTGQDWTCFYLGDNIVVQNWSECTLAAKYRIHPKLAHRSRRLLHLLSSKYQNIIRRDPKDCILAHKNITFVISSLHQSLCCIALLSGSK